MHGSEAWGVVCVVVTLAAGPDTWGQFTAMQIVRTHCTDGGVQMLS